jgi:superfamily II DNA or RNA helicase
MTTILRPYQSKIVKEISKAYTVDKLKGVLLQKGTGLGKTRTAAYIVDKYASTGRQVLWLVHREELLTQAALTFAENGIKHRLVCSKSSERAIKVEEFKEYGRSFVSPDAMVVIASIQTIVRRIDQLSWLNPAQIVADEAHLSLARTWRVVLARWPDARILGLTATPSRSDKQSFHKDDGGLYEVMVTGPSTKESVEMGYLAPIAVYAPPIKFKTGVKQKIKGGDYDPKTLEEEFDEPVIYGDVIKHYRLISLGEPAIAFCPTIKVAKKFAQEFCDAGFKAICLEGATDDTERRQALKKLGRGELDVIFNVNLLIEGTDIPYATTVMWLRRSLSIIVYLQGTGRVRRPHPLKKTAKMLDFVGITQIHGMPDDDFEWSLTGEVKRIYKKNDDDTPDVIVQVCPKCHSKDKPKAVCSVCGHEFTSKERKELAQVEGMLELKTPEQKEAERRAEEIEKRRERYEKLNEEKACKTLEDWIALGKKRGYKFSLQWAEHRWQARQGKVKQNQIDF